MDGVIETGDYFLFGRPTAIFRSVAPERVFIAIHELDQLNEISPVVMPKGNPGRTGQGRARGPAPEKRDEIKARMRELGPNQLRSMKEEEMASTFSASRDTCRRARAEVMSEFDDS
jgi:hypothetical protein